MKKQSVSKTIQIWREYEFTLYIPGDLTGYNKPYIFFNYKNENTGKNERIRKFIKKQKGDIKAIHNIAVQVVLDLIKMLEGNWNPITQTYNETKITPFTPVKDCIEHYILCQTRSYENEAIGFKRLKTTKIVMAHFKDYLTSQNFLMSRMDAFTNIHIKDFLDQKAMERNWGKVTYNCYKVDVGTFFNYFKNLKVLTYNPTDKVTKKTTKYDSSRFKVFEKDELFKVAQLLANDPNYFGLHVASKILFKYNIRPIEMTRIQVIDIDLEKQLLTLPSDKTKNQNEARFKLDIETIELLNKLIGESPVDWYIFGGRSRPSPTMVCSDYFGQNWRFFRKKHRLPSHLKFYALKHTSNYYDIEGGANFEEIRQRNRHANLQITTLYIKERLFKNVIKPSSQTLF